MGKIAILTCILGDFDKAIDPVPQVLKDNKYTFHRFTYENFPQIADLPPRFQYRIPKMFGWQMKPGFDYYVWLDGTVSFMRDDSLQYFLDQIGEADMGFFAHPNRKTIKEEVDHLETYLNRAVGTKRGQDYVLARYQGGLHKEQHQDILLDKDYVDDTLWASTMFIYRDSEKVRDFLRMWWLHTSRYFTVDQIVLPYLLWRHDIAVVNFDEPIYKSGYLSLVSQHK